MKQNNVFLFVFLLLFISLNIFADSLLEQGINEYNRKNQATESHPLFK